MKFEIKIDILDAILLDKSLKHYLPSTTQSERDKLITLVTKIGGIIADYNFDQKGVMENPVD